MQRRYPPAASETAGGREIRVIPGAAAAPARVSSSPGTPAAVLIVLLALLLPVYRVYESAAGRTNLCPADAVLPGLLLIYRRTWLRSGGMGWWLLALWATNLISWTLAASVERPIDLAQEMVKVLTCYGYALAGFGIAWHRRSESLLAKALTLTAIPIAAAGIVAFSTEAPQFLIKDHRVVGMFNDPNGYAVYLAMLFPIAASLPRFWLVAPVLIGGIVVTLSRTGLISAGLSMLLSLAHVPVRRYLPLVIACLVALAVVYGGARSISTTSRIFAYDESLSVRESLWSLGFDVASKHPLFGIGKGNWMVVTRAKNIPHNTLLQVAADEGFTGLVVFFVPLVLWLWAGLRRVDTRPWGVALCVALVGGLAVSFDNFRPFWLMTGLLVGKLSVPQAARQEELPVVPQSRARATWLEHMRRERT